MTPIPKLFEGYIGYNDINRKKVKAMSLSSDLIHSYAQTLYSLLLKPYMKSTGSWKTSDKTEDLADCLNNNREYFNKKKPDLSKRKISFGTSKNSR